MKTNANKANQIIKQIQGKNKKKQKTTTNNKYKTKIINNIKKILSLIITWEKFGGY